MKLIESKTLATATAGIEFTSIPQTYTDLVLLTALRSDDGVVAQEALIAFNGSTSSFSARQLYAFGPTVASTTPARQVGGHPSSQVTANTFGNTTIYIPNYSGSTNKSYSVESVTENNSSSQNFLNIVAGLWSDTAAITSLTISSGAGSLIAGSTISLYGITKGSDGIVTTS
jgi:hypothetical protein